MVLSNIEKPYNEKHRQIIQTGQKLFYKHGIKRVTIEEICKEANVSKMTFYKYFRNKNELVKEITRLILEINLKKYREFMDRTDITFEEKIRQTIEMKMEGTAEISAAYFDDYMIHSDADLAAFIQEATAKVYQEILNDYTEAQKRGDIRPDIKPEFIQFFLNHLLELAKDDMLLALYGHPQKLIMELVNFFFYGIMNRK
jgi:AcrR family transcriptional regulator